MLILYPSTCPCKIEIDNNGDFIRLIEGCKYHAKLGEDGAFLAVREEQSMKSEEEAKLFANPEKIDELGNLKEEYRPKLERVGDVLMVSKKSV